MSIVQCIVLGVVQGIGEFLPISSSAHLILVPYLLGWQESSMAFDIALHFGTLLAVLVIYFKEWWNLFIGACKNLFQKENTRDGQMFWYLVVATIPAALVGFLLDDIIEGFFRNQMWAIALLLALMGVFIYAGDRWASRHYRKKEVSFDKITLKQAFLVGCSQAFAVFPGFSRSGTTILAGRLMGLSKEAITKFTFLMSVPVIAGAAVLKIGELSLTREVLIGIFTSFVVGVLSIQFLLRYIKKHDFSIFAFYRIIIAILVYVKLIWFS